MQAGATAEAYARHKEDHLGTAAACAAQGVHFVPLVVNNWTLGSWRQPRPQADCGAVATRTGAEPGPLHDSLLLQELSVVVRSFRRPRRRGGLIDSPWREPAVELHAWSYGGLVVVLLDASCLLHGEPARIAAKVAACLRFPWCLVACGMMSWSLICHFGRDLCSLRQRLVESCCVDQTSWQTGQ
eukprot:s2717_g2.t1